MNSSGAAVTRRGPGRSAKGEFLRGRPNAIRRPDGIATGVLLTALRWSGVATLVQTPSPMNFLSRILERPPNERPFLLIPARYPALDATVPALAKKSLEEVMTLR